MDRESFQITKHIFGLDIVKIIDSYLPLPTAQSLIGIPNDDEETFEETYSEFCDGNIKYLIDILNNNGLSEVIAEHKDDTSNDEYYYCDLRKTDRFYITIIYWAVADDYDEYTLVFPGDLNFRVYRDYDFTYNNLPEFSKENIPFMLDVFNKDLDKFTTFVKDRFLNK